MLLAAALAAGCTVMPVPPAPAVPAASTTPVPDADAARPCEPGQPACPFELALARGQAPHLLHGRLTPEAPSRTYRICVTEAALLRWNWRGSAVHLVLEDPRGDVQGPGLPNPVRLELPDCYKLGVSANTMADDAFGEFSLSLSLDP